MLRRNGACRGYSSAAACRHARLGSGWPARWIHKKKKARADFVIDNNEDLAALAAQAKALWAELVGIAQERGSHDK